MRKLDIITIVAMVLSATIAFFIGELIINMTKNSEFSLILAEGFHFAIIGFLCILALVISTYKFSHLKEELSTTLIFKKVVIIFPLLALILSFALGSLFQYLYNMQIDNYVRQKNYIVAIDNSGSMDRTDPDFQRFEAVVDMMGTMGPEQNFGVYIFESYTKNIFPLQKINKEDIKKYSDDIKKFAYSSGSTNAMGVLNHIADDLTAGNFEGRTTIVMISDGSCEIDTNTFDRLNGLGIVVDTIQVSGAETINSLVEISEATGGEFYTIENVYELNDVLTNINKDYDFLLTDRRTEDMAQSGSHMFLRILFIFVLSALIGVFKVLTIDLSRVRKSVIVQSALFSVLAGILTEVLFENTDLSGGFIRFIMTFLICIVIVTYLKRNYVNSGGKDNIFRSEAYDSSYSGKDKNMDKLIK